MDRPPRIFAVKGSVRRLLAGLYLNPFLLTAKKHRPENRPVTKRFMQL